MYAVTNTYTCIYGLYPRGSGNYFWLVPRPDKDHTSTWEWSTSTWDISKEVAATLTVSLSFLRRLSTSPCSCIVRHLNPITATRASKNFCSSSPCDKHVINKQYSYRHTCTITVKVVVKEKKNVQVDSTRTIFSLNALTTTSKFLKRGRTFHNSLWFYLQGVVTVFRAVIRVTILIWLM